MTTMTTGLALKLLALAGHKPGSELESPMAIVVRSDESLTADDVIQFTHGKLAPFKTVKAVEFVDEIPRNPSGKILKKDLRQQYDYTAPE